MPSKNRVGWFVIAFVFVVLPRAGFAATPEQIETAIEKAKGYLYSQQNDGTWETAKAPDGKADGHDATGGQWGGTTALATYALLAAGENPQGQKLSTTIDFLKTADLQGTYAIGARMQVWSYLSQDDEAVRSGVRRDGNKLLNMVKIQGDGRGFYDYIDSGPDGSYSLSRAQYGVLGVWTAQMLGLEVKKTYWDLVEKSWLTAQDSSGGWAYKQNEKNSYPVTPGITAVGAATLYITQDHLHADEGAACKGNVENPAIERAMRWLIEHFDKVATDDEYARDYPYATLYAIERVGVAGGMRRFGTIDWYQKGADWLIDRQKKNGSWTGGRQGGTTVDTCFALLFLARGRSPLILTKLNYGAFGKDTSNWNQRPRDAANLTRWIGRQVERELNWQSVRIDAPLEYLQDAPILYIAGNQELKFNDEEKAKLKQFIEGGGLILGNADCSSRAFAMGFRSLAEQLFPKYPLRELPAEHPIYVRQQFAREKWRTKPSVLGVSNGVRELMLLMPQLDAAKNWQLQQVGGKEDQWQLAADIFQYATDGAADLRTRGQSNAIKGDESIKPTRVIKVTRLLAGDNPDPEPGGWRRMVALMHNRGVALTTEMVDPSKSAIDPNSVAHLTGTSKLVLDDAARKSILAFIKGGGTLIIDSAGGSGEFAQAVETELTQLFPDAKRTQLPPDHALYGSGKDRMTDFSYRRFTQAKLLGDAKGPRLQVIEQDGRPAVIYSREDLSNGMVGQPIDGVIGYTPGVSTSLMRAILQYAANAQREP